MLAGLLFAFYAIMRYAVFLVSSLHAVGFVGARLRAEDRRSQWFAGASR
jgi:hypothetical protein